MQPIEILHCDGGAGDVCRSILDALPEWFGIPESNADYVEQAERHVGVIASVGDQSVGVMTIVRHSGHAAEIYLMAVRPEWHRRGVGRQMLIEVERALEADGVEFLQVKTLSAAHPDAGYAKTREFYLANGFRHLEEFPDLWGPDNPALQLVKSL